MQEEALTSFALYSHKHGSRTIVDVRN